MALTNTTVTLLAVGCLAVGIGGTYMLTRPAPGSAPAADLMATAPVSDPAVTPAITEPDLPPPASNPAPEASATRPAPAPSPEAAVRPAPQAPRQPPASQTIPPASSRESDARPAPATAQPAPAAAAAAATTPARPVEPMFEELVVSAEAVIGLQMDALVSSEDAQVEDRVSATVTRSVRVGDRVAIPAGARAQGEVTLVERGGKLKDRARLAVRFTSVTLGDGTRVPISTDAILREGASASKESAAKIGGGAVGGAIIGGIIGGKKGAAIGSTVGAGAGTTAVMTGGRNAAVFESGAELTVKLLKPATVTINH